MIHQDKANQPGSDSLVCISGRPGNPDECPNGWNGRLWRAPADQKSPPEADPNRVQQICAPGYGDQDICNGDEFYAFLCEGKGKATFCPGIPPYKPKATSVSPTTSGAGQERTGG